VVEDSPTTRKVIALTRNQKGFAVIEAQDGMEALQKVNSE
jgi:twitching motility two-component system response regulator PilG